MAQKIAHGPDATPWQSVEAARAAIRRGWPDRLPKDDPKLSPFERRLIERARFSILRRGEQLLRMGDAGFFTDGPSPATVRAEVARINEALEQARRRARRLPVGGAALNRAHADLAGVLHTAAEIASKGPRVDRPQHAANLIVGDLHRNGWPLPTSAQLALLAIACGLERPCAPDEWPKRHATWKKRLRRAKGTRKAEIPS